MMVMAKVKVAAVDILQRVADGPQLGKERGAMRWMIGMVALAVATGAWAQEKPAAEVLDDPTAVVRMLEQEQKACRERLMDMGAKLEVIRSDLGREKDEEKRNAIQHNSLALNELRNLGQIRLNELNAELRTRKAQQLRQAFGEECDLMLAEPAQTRIPPVRLVGVVDVDGRRMLQFKQKDNGMLWTVDPKRIAAARVTVPAGAAPPTTSPGAAGK